MSLARTLMNGGLDKVEINPAKYGHEVGASLIAMESVAELHDIFLESYNYEQADIAAISEGVALEGSQYEAIAEASIKNAISKVKEFFIKLWNKIKAFFDSVKMHVQSLFIGGKKFVTKYKDQIDGIKELKDFKPTIYDFNNSSINEFDIDVDARIAILNNYVVKGIDYLDKNPAGSEVGEDTAYQTAIDTIDAEVNKLKDSSDVKEEWKKAYFGGDGEKHEKSVSKSDIDKFVKALESDTSKSFQKVQQKVKDVYSNVIKMAEANEKKLNNNYTGGGASQLSKLFGKYASYVSRLQSEENIKVNTWKSAVNARDAQYKAVIVAAISNSRKAAKKAK